MAPIRIGTCSWADEGLVKRWYPRGVSSPAARLAYYAERFDVVEVDSPFYHLPSPETAAKWAERTPAPFVFHVKASGEMTGHREAGLAEWVEPLGELAGRAEEVYALFNNNRYDYAPRSAQLLRGLLDEREIPASGGVEPPATGQLELGA